MRWSSLLNIWACRCPPIQLICAGRVIKRPLLTSVSILQDQSQLPKPQVAASHNEPPGEVESPAVHGNNSEGTLLFVGECSVTFLLIVSWPSGEVQRWELGRKKLASIMGADPESFSEKEVTEALRYLLPTRLTAVDAQPLLKVTPPL